jgi:hypothetical protein
MISVDTIAPASCLGLERVEDTERAAVQAARHLAVVAGRHDQARAMDGVGVEGGEPACQRALLEVEGGALGLRQVHGIGTRALDALKEPQAEGDGAAAEELATQRAVPLGAGPAGLRQRLARAAAAARTPRFVAPGVAGIEELALG